MPNTAATNQNMERHFFRASAADFKKIPGSPIAYWVSDSVRKIFSYPPIESITISDGQNKTGNNDKFVRSHWEVSKNCVGIKMRWFFYAKGGGFRRWFGNLDDVIDWSEDARLHYRKDHVCRIIPEYLWYKKGITWGLISSAKPSFRLLPSDATFDVGGSSIFFKDDDDITYTLGLLNTHFALNILKISNPTLNFQVKNIREIPFASVIDKNIIEESVKSVIALSKTDWNSYETSWDFATLPLLQSEYHQPTLKDTYTKLREHWQEMTLEMQRLEEENNRIFIDAYGLQDELTPDVPLEEITLTCNPRYRYSGKKSDEELEALLLADTLKELISYAVGCMMGRYSLDEAGLVYAESQNQGFDHSKYKTFPADDDGIVPIMDMDWFEDDAAKRFVEFIKTAWTQEKLNENLKFIADILNPKSNESPENIIRQYFSSSFFKDHLRTYKKRPIYWLFSSGKQKAFEALVYLHRYNESTLARMRANYVTPLQGNINARIEFMEHEKNSSAAASSQRKIQKEIDALKKKQLELKAFDDELRHFADMKISLDLDDGVKVNYSRFGNLLADKKVVV